MGKGCVDGAGDNPIKLETQAIACGIRHRTCYFLGCFKSSQINPAEYSKQNP
jgi:hypothetical protein